MMKESRQQIQRPGETPFEIRERARAVYSTLSNRDAYEIFSLAARGFASTSILREQKFSKKRYYLRLKCLINLGLVYKDGGMYRQTVFGRLVDENQVKLLETLLEDIAHPT